MTGSFDKQAGEKKIVTEEGSLSDLPSDEETRLGHPGSSPDSKTEAGEDYPPAEVHYDELPQGRQLGTISAIFLMVNRILGTGVFSTTSTILEQSGSAGMSIIYWVIGGVIAGCGFAVYAEFATAMHRNGGELNYLQHVYRKPKHLVASAYAAQALLLGQAAGNANAAGQYFLRAGKDPNRVGEETDEWSSKGIGIAVILSALFMHAALPKYGLIFQNTVGLFKVVILLLIVFAGFAALAGRTIGPAPHNLSHAFVNSRSDVYGVCQCIYNAIWSYVGYSNLFYALGEVKNPARTMKIAGIVSLVTLTILYVLCQVAYFAAVPMDEILNSKQIIAAAFFKHMFGERSAKALSVFVALSAVANVFAVLFAQGRLNQALGRDNIIPFAKMFASNRPFNTPLAGLSWHAIVTLILMLAPPQGDAYQLVLSLAQYPLNVVNTAVGLGLCLTYVPVSSRFRVPWLREWRPTFRATLPIAIFFTLVSAFLVVVPWIPPPSEEEATFKDIWYGMAPSIALGFFGAGALYWFCWYLLMPALGKYKLVERQSSLKDGTPITVFDRVHPSEVDDHVSYNSST